MMNKLSYKTAGPEDTDLIADLAEKIWKDHYISIISMDQIEYMLKKMYSTESLKQQMKDGHVFTLVFLDEIPIGYISISTKDNQHYYLHKFYITSEVQRKGLGSELLGHILSGLPNASGIELTVNRKNFKAINFYFRNGFAIQDVADFDIGEGYFMNDFIMHRRLF
jgi:ribosomal protein S18 acetylase RimI-like enzyme